MSSIKTMAGWPLLIKSFDEIPSMFKSSMKKEAFEREEFPYMIFIPSFRAGFKRYDPMIVYHQDKKFYMVEKDKKLAETTVLPFEDINFVETGTVLLNSWVRLGGVINGKPSSKKFEFNSVAVGLFTCIVELLRRNAVVSSENTNTEDQKEKFTFLGKINYKFMSYGRQSLMPCSKVVKMFVQPEIPEERLKIFEIRLFKKDHPSHLSIITENELIILNDVDGRYSKYGITFTYISLSRITEPVLEREAQKGRYVLRLKLKSGDNITLLISEEKKEEAEQFIETLKLGKETGTICI